MVVAEALATGTPVVAPDSCGPSEIVTPDCGRLYRPGDARAAATALVAVLGDPAGHARMAAAARVRAEAAFDLAATQARYAALLNELAPDRPGGWALSPFVSRDKAPNPPRSRRAEPGGGLAEPGGAATLGLVAGGVTGEQGAPSGEAEEDDLALRRDQEQPPVLEPEPPLGQDEGARLGIRSPRREPLGSPPLDRGAVEGRAREDDRGAPHEDPAYARRRARLRDLESFFSSRHSGDQVASR
jgi:hypothetical protein